VLLKHQCLAWRLFLTAEHGVVSFRHSMDLARATITYYSHTLLSSLVMLDVEQGVMEFWRHYLSVLGHMSTSLRYSLTAQTIQNDSSNGGKIDSGYLCS
jgi:hypothetical protein